MPAAPIYGGDYMRIMPPLVSNPPNVGEYTPTLDPNFIAAWNSVQEQCPVQEDGDYAFKLWVANVAYRYAMGTTTFVPSITSISPTTAVHGPGAVTITITGTKFDANAMPMWNGVDMVPTTRTLTQIVFTTSAPTAGTYNVQVRNSDGATTAATVFTAT